MISIVAPYPNLSIWKDGYSIRILSIDQNIFSHEKRVYINIDHNLHNKRPSVEKISELITKVTLNPEKSLHKAIVLNYFLRSKLIYFHSVYQVLKLNFAFMLGKTTVVDLHGLAPEEQLMIGDVAQSEYLTKADAFACKKATHIIAVTEAMAEHYRWKYPKFKANIIILPIFEQTPHPKDNNQIIPEKKRIIYCGSAQAWQNIDYMMEVISKATDYKQFTILTSEIEPFQKKISDLKLKNVILKTVQKDELEEYYHSSDYGFVLRDKNIVNTVSCPTKLIEYMCYGVLPIVSNPNIGDFQLLGYKYLSVDDFLKGKFPSTATYKSMLLHNYKLIESLITRVIQSQESLRHLIK